MTTRDQQRVEIRASRIGGLLATDGAEIPATWSTSRIAGPGPSVAGVDRRTVRPADRAAGGPMSPPAGRLVYDR